MAPAERADVIVDFPAFPPGTTINLLNVGPDEPFGGGIPGVDFDPADPDTTGQVMQFRVVARYGHRHQHRRQRSAPADADTLWARPTTSGRFRSTRWSPSTVMVTH